MSAKAISSAVEGGGGFVRDASQKRQHALDSADVVREAIARFPKSDLELGENKDVAFQAFTDCQQCVSQSVFLDVWTMAQNADLRPVFLEAVATPDVVHTLLGYVRPLEDGQPRPSYLVTNAMGVLNRLCCEPRVASLIAQSHLMPVLEAFAATVRASHGSVNTRLMVLEVLAVLLPCAPPAAAEEALDACGWVALLMHAMEAPRESAGEAQYHELECMLACRVLTGVVCSPAASAQFVTSKAGPLFTACLGSFQWVASEGCLHALMHSVHNQLDRLPSLTASASVQPFLGVPSAASKLADFAVVRARIQGTPVCVACGRTDAKLSVCGQCKRRGVTYCQRNCQAKDWKRHKQFCTPQAKK